MKLNHFIITGLLVTATFVACNQKEEPYVAPEEEVPVEEPVEGDFSYIFKVGNPETKTTFDTDHVAWNADDQVASYALTSLNKSTPVTIDGSGIPHITIRSSVALSAGNMVYAYYPHNSRNNSKEADAVTLEIPRNQISGSADAMPMVALPFELTGDVPKYTNQEVGTIRFLNLGSVVKLNIFSSNASYQGEKIENVTFQAGAACAGTFTYDLTTVNATSPAAISGYSETDVVVTGNGASPITVGADKDHAGVFYFVVAPGTYNGVFKIRTNRADYTYDSTGKFREYKRAGLKPLNIDLASANWIPATGYDNSIDSPRELAAFLAGTSSSDTGSYTISADLDMSGYTITSASGFGGTLDGGDHSIKNLTSTVPLFATNSGTISNLIIDESCAFTVSSNRFAPLVAEGTDGTYNSVRNKASVTFTATADVSEVMIIGGIVAVSAGETFSSCSNSGAITFDATGKTHVATSIGGIVGLVNDNDGKNAVFNNCVNRGPISLYAKYGDPTGVLVTGLDAKGINVGGILGTTGYSGSGSTLTFESCINEEAGIITFRHTNVDELPRVTNSTGPLGIAGIIGLGSNSSFNKCRNYALIDVKSTLTDPTSWAENESNEKKRTNYMMCVGGIGGYGWDAIGGMSSCTNDGDIEVEFYGVYTDNDGTHPAVGGICGGVCWNSGSGYAYYCKQRGNITVTGRSTMAVGGIFGFCGKQIKNEVTGNITVNGLKGDVGGLVGYLQGSAEYCTIKGCTFSGNIFADSCWGDVGKTNYYCLGGLIGRWAGANTSSHPCLTNRDGDPCVFSGSVSSVYQNSHVGIVVGRVKGSSATKVFGESDNPIQATGTIQKNGLSQTTLTSANIDTYKWGSNEGTTTIYVTCPTPAPSNLTLMSFNIREGSNWTSRRDPIVSMINGESPDIIGLQEVKDLDSWDLAKQGKHPWNYLKDNLSAYTGYRNGSYHNAILYKTSTVELSNTGIFFLRDDYNTSGNSWDGYERTALYATVREKATGKYFFYITTHFPMNDNNDGWQKSTALLENRIAALNTNNYPVILMGDFNCVIGNACWDGIKTWMNNTRYSADTIVSTENRDLYTYNAFGDTSKARNKVDHIWVSKSGINVDSYVTLTNAIRSYGGYTTNGETFLSDHYPIIAHIS